MKSFKIEFREDIIAEHSDRVCYPSIVETMNTLTQKEADEIYDYMMHKGTMIIEWVSPDRDPMNKNIWVPMADFTDGKYFWNQMNAYVIKTYKIKVPQSFKDHVKRQMASGRDFANLDGDSLKKKFDKICDEIESYHDKSYNIWCEGEQGALVIDLDESLEKCKIKPQK